MTGNRDEMPEPVLISARVATVLRPLLVAALEAREAHGNRPMDPDVREAIRAIDRTARLYCGEPLVHLVKETK